MAREWAKVALAEAGVKLIDCVHDTPADAGEGLPYVAIPQMKEGRIDLMGARRITPADFTQWTQKADPQPFDVVLSRRCNPGVTAHVPPGVRFALGQNLVLLRADGKKVFPPFLRWMTRTPHWWDEISRFLNVGAVFDSLRCADVPKFVLPLPPLPEQRRIAAILGALDDKIELNRRMTATLEELARAQYDAWLPTTRTDAATVSSLIERKLLDVGDGYRAKRTELDDEGLPFARAGNIDNGFHFDGAEMLGAAGVKAAREKVSRPGDVVFTSKGTVGRFAFVQGSTLIFVYSPQLCYWRSLATDRISPVFLLYWMRSPDFLDQVAAVKGQTDMAEYVSLRDQRRMVIMLPTSGDQKRLDFLVRPLVERQDACVAESRTLTNLRDTLLPKLISGELRVPESEAAVDEAAG